MNKACHTIEQLCARQATETEKKCYEKQEYGSWFASLGILI